MNTFLTVAAFMVLIAAAAYVIHRLNIQHADRIAAPPIIGERRDHRDGGSGRFPPRRRRSRTTHHR